MHSEAIELLIAFLNYSIDKIEIFSYILWLFSSLPVHFLTSRTSPIIWRKINE